MSERETTPDFSSERIALPAVLNRNERLTRAALVLKLRRLIGKIPFADDLAAAYYCAIDPFTPLHVRAVLFAAAAYFVMPADMIPDFIAGLGFTDDATVLTTAVTLVGAHIKERHRVLARDLLLKPEPQPEPA